MHNIILRGRPHLAAVVTRRFCSTPWRGSAELRLDARSASQESALQDWLEGVRTLRIQEVDKVDGQKARQLAGTLPYPAGSTAPDVTDGAPLPPAWHLINFPPERGVSHLGHDGTERGALFPPDEAGPMERMWASGSMHWRRDNPLRIGQELECTTSLDRFEVKQGKRGPMVFVYQSRVVSNRAGPSLTEVRCHMYRRPVPASAQNSAPPPSPKPPSPPYLLPEGHPEAASWSYVPSMVQLFRFSALTFNSHRIHYDRRYCVEEEHRPDCVVHGPLTALLLCESLRPQLQDQGFLESLTYRALSPLYVNRKIGFSAYCREKQAKAETWPVWATSDEGVVSMGGEAVISR